MSNQKPTHTTSFVFPPIPKADLIQAYNETRDKIAAAREAQLREAVALNAELLAILKAVVVAYRNQTTDALYTVVGTDKHGIPINALGAALALADAAISKAEGR